MISDAKMREILGEDGNDLTDEQMREFNNAARRMAELLIRQYTAQCRQDPHGKQSIITKKAEHIK
jgi:hypothetical protein